MTELDTLTVSITDDAIVALEEVRERDKIASDKYLRVGVEGGGCSGLSYILNFDEKGAFDEEFEIKGMKVIMDKRHALYVAGMEVDYQSGLNDRGFIFNNPNAKTSCGCGTSFST